MKSFAFFQPWLWISALEPEFMNVSYTPNRLEFTDKIPNMDLIGQKLEKVGDNSFLTSAGEKSKIFLQQIVNGIDKGARHQSTLAHDKRNSCLFALAAYTKKVSIACE